MNTLNTHRFTLKSRTKKATCPACQKRRFVNYVDVSTNEILDADVGRCDREQSCGYHFKPKDYFSENPLAKKDYLSSDWVKPKAVETPPINYIPFEVVKKSMQRYERNHFTTFLKNQFGVEKANELIQHFYIGSSRMWQNSGTIFWQIDKKGKVHHCKAMLYNPATGKRVKREKPTIFFLGKKILKELDIKEPNLHQCFFGEHQLTDKNKDKTVCIVESEKTAILMTAKMPTYIWLATGGKNGCKWREPNVFLALIGRKVILCPDLGVYDDWNKRAETIKSYGINISVSDTLEKAATKEDWAKGYDLADYFIK